MNRREAIAALTVLPGLTRISKADLKPTDVLVCEVDGFLSESTKDFIKSQLEQVWPGQKIVVLEHGMTLKVVTQQGTR